ncbi:alpha-L-fucosidase [Fundicoccus culcitae]|uniref:alpha-L-fucosidase n=1 Tax=Fundicoccus culcitae TaxID=2969821 RepID=A0ABY5P8G5_9LACT|nr:alpha-L-fucosidase [Fundicoccus culcitae]UUX35051.1 alpha-L-fucosidase [Fundicoccus culcitae]
MKQKIHPNKQWFIDSRFGMFIHFGLYSSIGRGEWVRSSELMTIEAYQPYFDSFNPRAFDAEQWAKAASEAGMKYIILTAKHHDGFCLYDSKYTDYKITNTPFGRDLVAEYLEAARKYNLKVGLYFSLIDWYHPDFPKYADRHHPMRGNEAYRDEDIDWENYLTFMHNQVEELVTQYGELDIMWFDFSYDDMSGEKWDAEKLMNMVSQHQPNIVIDNRLETSGEGFGSIVDAEPTSYAGDYISPEHIIPPYPIKDVNGNLVPWELCTSINNSWGYDPTDCSYKSAKFIIRKLVECISKNGNILLNIPPDGTGKFNTQSLEVLSEIGDWMSLNGDAIYENGPAIGLEKPEWGYYTQKDDQTIYAHIFDGPLGVLPLPGLASSQITSVKRVMDNSVVKISDSWTALAFPDTTFVELHNNHATEALADDIDMVLEIKLK